MPNPTLAQMGFLDEDTQQEVVYDIEDSEARSDISTLENKIGSANGIAELDSNGKVPSAQLPSYVDDVLEYASESAFPAIGETGKIYVALDTNKTFRWSGSAYVEISESLALGETSSTAYAGNKGKANADAIDGMKNGSSIDSFGDVETALANKVDKVTGKGLSTNDYDNTAKGIVDNIQDNVIANTKLIKDTVGWSRKNLLDNDLTNTFPVIEKNGVTFSIQKDNSIIVNGTATANITDYFIKTHLSLKAGKYICTGNPEGTTGFVTGLRISDPSYATVNYFFEGGFELTLNSDIDELRVDIRVGSGATFNNVIFKPMIRSAYILDDTYEPYFGSTAFPRSEQAVLGAKNRFNFDAWKGIARTDATATWGDDSLTLVATAANGRTNLSISDAAKIHVNAGEVYKFTWEDGGSGNSAKFEVINPNDTQHNLASVLCTDEELLVTVPSGCTELIYRVIIPTNGQTAIISKIMCTLATDPDPTYAPFAMTNKELTEKKIDVPQVIANNTDLDNIQKSGVYYAYGPSGLSHNPEGNNIFTLFVTELHKDNFVHQILIVVTGSTSLIYCRRLGASPATWGSWIKFEGTIVS